MDYNFDEIVNRRNTNTLKYDFNQKYNKPEDITPLWIADMDFKVAPMITQAIQNCVNHGIYGYTESKDDYFFAISNWFATRFGYHIKQDWLVKTPGMVYAIGMAVKAYTCHGEGVLIQEPLYAPIKETILANGRNAVINNLVYSNGEYTIDLEDFEDKIASNNVKLFVLCNPHNPVGRVWTAQELLAMGKICKKHNCLVLSDEIHCDITFNGHRHHVFSNIDASFGDMSIICTAPSKTFNIAGLQISNIFIENEDLRQQFKAQIAATGYSQLNTIGLAACQAAYTYGANWLNSLLQYLTQNLNFAREFVDNSLQDVTLVSHEGTYLLWFDFSKFCKAHNLTHDQMDELLTTSSKLWLNSGTTFGPAGSGFWRMNIACPKAILEDAMARLVALQAQVVEEQAIEE